MYPPRVYELTSPSSHKTRSITKIVQSMSILFGYRRGGSFPSIALRLADSQALPDFKTGQY